MQRLQERYLQGAWAGPPPDICERSRLCLTSIMPGSLWMPQYMPGVLPGKLKLGHLLQSECAQCLLRTSTMFSSLCALQKIPEWLPVGKAAAGQELLLRCIDLHEQQNRAASDLHL